MLQAMWSRLKSDTVFELFTKNDWQNNEYRRDYAFLMVKCIGRYV